MSKVVSVKPDPVVVSGGMLPDSMRMLLQDGGWAELFSLSTANRGPGAPPWNARRGVLNALVDVDGIGSFGELIDKLQTSVIERDNDLFESLLRDVESRHKSLAKGRTSTPKVPARPPAKIKKEKKETSLIEDFGSLDLEDNLDFHFIVRSIAMDVERNIPDLITFQAATQEKVSSLAESFAMAAGISKPKRQHFMLAWCHVLKSEMNDKWTNQDVKDALSLFIASQLAFDELGWNVVERLVSVRQLGLTIDNDSVQRAIDGAKPKKRISNRSYSSPKSKDSFKGSYKAPQRGRPSK